MLVSADPDWVAAAVASWWSPFALAAAAIGLVTVAWRLGRVRGPVVPGLPFIDHVVAGPLDRALVLRERITLTLLGGGSIGLLLGAIVSGGFVGSGVGGPLAVGLGAVAGALCGVAAALAWFAGQAGRIPRHGLGPALRGLRLEDLRRQAIRTTHVGGAVLAGDLRAVRLDVATPVTRGRAVRLRPGGARRTIVRRDLLGLRRSPGQAFTGAGLTVVGAALGAVALTQVAAPVVLGAVAAGVLYFGFGALAEGLRLVADNAGTTPLLGLGFRAEATAHLVVPAGAFLLLALPVTILVVLPPGGSALLAALAVVVLAGLLCGATLLAAFRGSPPDSSFVPEFGPIAMTYWYARPLALAAVSGGLFLDRLTHADGRVAPVLLVGAGSALALIWLGLRAARTLELGHRV